MSFQNDLFKVSEKPSNWEKEEFGNNTSPNNHHLSSPKLNVTGNFPSHQEPFKSSPSLTTKKVNVSSPKESNKTVKHVLKTKSLCNLDEVSAKKNIPFFSKVHYYPLSPRSESLKASTTENSTTVTPTLPLSLQDDVKIEGVTEHLNEFVDSYQKQLQLIREIFDSEAFVRQTQVDLSRQMLLNAFKFDWVDLCHKMNKFFQQGDDLLDVKEIEKNSNLRSINWHNLGLHNPLDYQSIVPTKLPLNKTSISQTKKSLKEEKHLQIALEFIRDLLLDFHDSDPWKRKENVKKMLQFVPKKLIVDDNFDKDKTLPMIVFNYIYQLFLLGEILKQGSYNIDNLSKDEKSLLANQPLEHAKTFLKCIREIHDIKKLEKEEKRVQIDTWCSQCGDCVISCAKSLGQVFTKYIEETNDLQFKREDFYDGALNGQMQADILQQLFNCFSGFDNDFERSVKGKFLHLASDKKDIGIPKITKDIRKDDEKYVQYCRSFLLYLMENLGIDCKKSELDPFNPLEKLEETKSIGIVYEKLEQAWKKAKGSSDTKIESSSESKVESSSDTKIDGVFKLLPILRIFSQNNILAIHKAIFRMQNVVEALEPPQVSHVPITSTPPIVEHSKTRKNGEFLDRETKRIQIEFKDNAVQMTVKRLNVLAHSSIPEKCFSTEYCFIGCFIRTSFILSASIDDLETWAIQTVVEIDRPKEMTSFVFLRRYSLLITILDAMGIQYNVNVS